MDLSNKIIIVACAALIIHLSFTFIKNKKLLEENQENFQNNLEFENPENEKISELDAEEIEIMSPSYSDKEASNLDESYELNESKQKFNNSDYNDVLSNQTGIDDILENNIDKIIEEDDSGKQRRINMNNKKNVKDGFKGTSVEQSGIDGTGNIFTPQIIIQNDENGQSVGMRSTPNEKVQTIYKSNKNWQMPANNLYEDDNEIPYSKLGKDPWDNVEENMRQSYNQYKKDKNTCGGITAPFSKGNDNVLSGSNSDNIYKNRHNYKPGYTFMPPTEWDIPQPRPPNCIPDKWKRPSAVFDRGTPMNVLELDENGDMLMDEERMTFTNVGSILPRFRYEEYTDY